MPDRDKTVAQAHNLVAGTFDNWVFPPTETRAEIRLRFAPGVRGIVRYPHGHEFFTPITHRDHLLASPQALNASASVRLAFEHGRLLAQGARQHDITGVYIPIAIAGEDTAQHAFALGIMRQLRIFNAFIGGISAGGCLAVVRPSHQVAAAVLSGDSRISEMVGSFLVDHQHLVIDLSLVAPGTCPAALQSLRRQFAFDGLVVAHYGVLEAPIAAVCGGCDLINGEAPRIAAMLAEAADTDSTAALAVQRSFKRIIKQTKLVSAGTGCEDTTAAIMALSKKIAQRAWFCRGTLPQTAGAPKVLLVGAQALAPAGLDFCHDAPRPLQSDSLYIALKSAADRGLITSLDHVADEDWPVFCRAYKEAKTPVNYDLLLLYSKDFSASIATSVAAFATDHDIPLLRLYADCKDFRNNDSIAPGMWVGDAGICTWNTWVPVLLEVLSQHTEARRQPSDVAPVFAPLDHKMLTEHLDKGDVSLSDLSRWYWGRRFIKRFDYALRCPIRSKPEPWVARRWSEIAHFNLTTIRNQSGGNTRLYQLLRWMYRCYAWCSPTPSERR